MELFLQEVRSSVRTLIKDRVSSAIAVVTLALGIGAVSLVFSVTAGLLTARIPYERPEQIWILQPNLTDWRLFELLESSPGPFEKVAAYNERAANITDAQGAERILVGRVTAAFLSVTGTRTAAGRAFSKDEFLPRQPTVLLLTDAFWRRRFGGSPHVIGQAIALDDRVYTVVGVLAPGFKAPQDLPSARSLAAHVGADVLLPLTGNPRERDPLSTDRMWRGVTVLGRSQSGTSLEQGRDHVRGLARRLPARQGQRLDYTLRRLPDYVAGDLPKQLAILAAAVTLLLVVASVNVMQLLLARGLARRQEMATRSALGAPRSHLVRCGLSEALLLGLSGGILGIGLAWAGRGALVGLAAGWLSRLDQVRLDWRVLAFTALLSAVTGLAVGIIPGLQVSRIDPLPVLRGQVDSLGRLKHAWLRELLVVGQIALSLVLLVGGGLLAKDFLRLTRVDLGFDPTGVVLGELSLSRLKYGDATKGDAFFRQLLDQTAAMPGVKSVALTNSAPGGPSMAMVNVVVRGHGQVLDDALEEFVRCEVVAGHYFATLAIPMRAGRSLDEGDHRAAEPVVVVNEAFARKHWGLSASAIDEPVRFGDREYRVVGVAGNVQAMDGAAEPRIYFPYEQFAGWSLQMTLLLHVTAGADTFAPLIAKTVADLNRLQPIYDVRPLRELVVGPLARRALIVAMVAVFALVTIVVACVGVYGATSCAVAERVREIAIRLALGGSASRVVATIARRGALRVLQGVTLGVVFALSLTSLMRAQLVGVTHTDFGTYAAVTVLVAALGLCGSVVPVLKVIRGEPLDSFRID
jgi:predicted permease